MTRPERLTQAAARRIALAAQASTGFVYYVSRTGVTGAPTHLSRELVREVRQVKKRVRMPLAVGFGISTPRQVADVAQVADGVVVGSALVRLVEEYGRDPELPSALEQRVRELTAPLQRR